MVKNSKSFTLGLSAGACMMLGADALHWFISAYNPAIHTTRMWAVMAQAVICFGAAIWFWRKDRIRAGVGI